MQGLNPELISSKDQPLHCYTFLASLTFNYEKSFFEEVTVISHQTIASNYQDICSGISKWNPIKSLVDVWSVFII